MKHTTEMIATLLTVVLLGGCGGIAGQDAGDGPDGSIAVEGPDPTRPSTRPPVPIFTDDPAFNRGAQPDESADDLADSPPENDTTPPPDNAQNAGPDPAPEPEPFPGVVANGRALYRLNCEECHGRDAVGGTAVGIRRASVAKITKYINGAERHPKFGGISGLTVNDVQDIAAYLHSL